jgi:ribonuclease P protein component
VARRRDRPLSFPKDARLRKRPEFLAAKERGRSFSEGPLAASFKARAEPATPTRQPVAAEMKAAVARVGLTVSSKVGGAVVRNRVKRKLREAVRHELDQLPAVDLVLVARQGAREASVAELRRWLHTAARRMRGRASPEGKR